MSLFSRSTLCFSDFCSKVLKSLFESIDYRFKLGEILHNQSTMKGQKLVIENVEEIKIRLKTEKKNELR
ncbi:MAG: hypothetical protein DRQ10_07745 [Candidatus Hydrothermota bacterium]|nr:MAG: hypothetical protein DRQ10_07745 [Candidatus Hydrothermae bacterium]